MIIHITTRKEWEKAEEAGFYSAPSLQTDGFIHCSLPSQTVETANTFFRGHEGLMLLVIDEKKLASECKFEAPTVTGIHDPSHEALFPHVYGPINLDAVIKIISFPPGDDGLFILPELQE